MPTRKVSVSAVAGFLTTIGFWLLSVYEHVDPPSAVVAATTGLIMVGLAYAVPEKDQAA